MTTLFNIGSSIGINCNPTYQEIAYIIGKDLTKVELYADVAIGVTAQLDIINPFTSDNIASIVVYGNGGVQYVSTTTFYNLPSTSTLYEINWSKVSGTGDALLHGLRLLE